MAIKVNGTTVIGDSRQLTNIASVDATTAASITAAGVGGGGSQTFTASGAIASKVAAKLNTDGTVSEITPSVSIAAPVIIDAEDISSPATADYLMVAKLTETTGVAVAHNNGAASASAYYFSIDASGNITLGSPITLGNDAFFIDISFLFRSDTNKVCFCYQSTSNYAANVIVITVSGTSLSAGSQSIFVPQSSIYNAWAVGTNGTGGIVFGASNSTGRAYLRAGIVESNTISLGGETQVTSAQGRYVKHIMGKPSTDDWAVFLHDTSNTAYAIKATASVISVTGYSSEVIMAPVSGVYTDRFSTSYDVGIDKVWFTQRAGSYTTVGTFTMPSTQTTISFDDNKVAYGLVVWNIESANGIAWAGNLTGSSTILQYEYNGASTALTQKPTVMPAGYSHASTARYGFSYMSNFMIGGAEDTTASQFKVAAFSSLDASTFVGISDETALNGASVSVVIPSGIVEGLTGLTAGENYTLFSGVPQEATSGAQVKALSSTTAQVKF